MFDIEVLGVDPGLARMGLAVVARRAGATSIVWSETVRTHSGIDESTRLMALAAATRRVIQTYGPDAVAIERVAFNRNAVSALAVARAIGALMLVAADSGVAVHEYTPTQVKSAISGAGDADKDQVRAALIRMHGLADVPSQPDAADAVAVALTHINGAGLRAAAARAGRN